jgi:hypothetical protein
MNNLSIALILTALIAPITASAMPDWDGIYACSSSAKDKKYVALKNTSNKLHIIGFSSEVDKLNNGLDCTNDNYAPKSNTVDSSVVRESVCDDKTLSQSVTFTLGKTVISVKIAVTQTSPNGVDISIGNTREIQDLRDNQEIIYHCEK